MSYNTTIANPASVTNLNPNGIVSDLENVLMQSIGQGIQTDQSTDSGSLQQEMQLLTELLNQSNTAENNPSQTTGSDPQSSKGSKNDTGINKTESKLDRVLEQDITKGLQNGQTPNNGNALEQEMNLLIQLLGQGA